jgi:hypothetical protein
MVRVLDLMIPPGNNFVGHPYLAYANIISVKREGSREYPVLSGPTGTAANIYHNKGLGRLEWSIERLSNDVVVDENGFVLPEFIHVIYEADF